MKKFIFKDLQTALKNNFKEKDGLIKIEIRKIKLFDLLEAGK